MQTGDHVPDFDTTDQNGNQRKFSEFLADGPVVLFFYPKAMTTGCTKESCHFRDLAGEFADVGAQRIGISADSVERQAAFDDKHGLGYPLISDTDKSIAAIFGVKRSLLPFSKRNTFVIDSDGTVLERIASETNMDVHADRALALLRERAAR
ncbi:MAG TPA: peroxiredoxin [Microthrixaceae bacterium]|nr:peroxiredoxin [Microthrixaceae bacterium]